MKKLMGGVPTHISITKLREDILDLKFVQKIHDFHIWEESPDSIYASCHLVVNETPSVSLVQTIFKSHGVFHLTVQFIDKDKM